MRQSMKIGFALLLAVGLAVVKPAMSQEVTAGIVGTVSDPSGAPIKDATAITPVDASTSRPYQPAHSPIPSPLNVIVVSPLLSKSKIL